MSLDVTEVERALMALAPDDRVMVIERGLLSLHEVDDADQAALDAAWLAEINRRVDAYASGHADLVDVDEHITMARARLAAPER